MGPMGPGNLGQPQQQQQINNQPPQQLFNQPPQQQQQINNQPQQQPFNFMLPQPMVGQGRGGATMNLYRELDICLRSTCQWGTYCHNVHVGQGKVKNLINPNQLPPKMGQK